MSTDAPADANEGGSAVRKSALRRGVSILFGIALTAGILAWLWHRHGLDLSSLSRGSRQTDLLVVGLVFVGSAAFGLLVGAHKLHLILRSMGVPIRFRDTLLIRLGSAPARALLPFASGELLQVLWFRSAARLPLARGSGAVVFDKAVNFMGALLWLAVGIGLMIPGEPSPAAFGLAFPMIGSAVAAMLLACLLAVFATPAHGLALRWAVRIHPKLSLVLSGVLEPFRQLDSFRKLTLLGYGALFQARPLIVCHALLAAAGLHPGLRAVLAASAAAVCAGYAPGFVAGSGPREAVLLELLRPAGVPAETGFFVGALLTLSVNVVPAVIGAPWALWMVRGLRARPIADAQEAP